MDKINDTLGKIGLSKNEILIYLTLLKIGSSQVSDIAKRSEIYRPYVYDTLERLLEKGLVNFVNKNNKKFFQAVDPSQLLDIEKERVEELGNIIPELKRLIETPKNISKVEMYSGKKVVRVIQKDVFKTLLKMGGESLVIGVDEKKFKETDPVIMDWFFAQMKNHKFKERVLVREGDNFLPSNEKTTNYRYLEKEFFEPTSTFIYGNKVAIIIFDEPLHGMIIESKPLASTYKKQFELLWKIGKTKNI